MKDNIRRKLTDLLLPEQIRESIIKDIFGFQQGAHFVKGLLDSSSPADFDRRLSLLVITLPFELKLCAGCRKGYPRAPDGKSCLPAPKDLCLVHKEQHMYYNVVNCKQQLSSLTNVHYHANSSCPKARFPDFNPRAVQIPDDIKVKTSARPLDLLISNI